MTFKEYVERINKLLEENPDWAKLEIIPVEKWAEEDVIFHIVEMRNMEKVIIFVFN